MTIQHVVIIIAMEAEAQPTVEILGLRPETGAGLPKACPAVLHSGSVDTPGGPIRVTIVCNGKSSDFGVDNVGTVPAALSTFLAIEALKPDIVINAGTCGGFQACGGRVGDVYVSTGVANHDRRIQIPGFDKYGVCKLACHPTSKLQAALGIKAGVVSSGNSLDWNEDDMRQMKANDAACKEMEGAAVGWACQLHGTPFFCIKAVTDIVDGTRPTHEEFLENLGTAAEALKKALVEVVRFLGGKALGEV